MDAVNLIPGDTRTRGQRLSVSRPTLALIAGLVIVLVGVVLYVTSANTVATRNSELAQVNAGVASWTAAANSYAPFVRLAEQRTTQLTDVRQLASSRVDWSGLLGQIGGQLPLTAQLISLQAAMTATTSAAATSSIPSVQLSGCAASQSAVAQTMVQLRRVTGVSGVSLSSSTDSGAGSDDSGAATSDAGSTSQTSGGCDFPVQFQVSLTFKATATTTSAATPSPPAASTSTAPITQ